MTYFSKLFLPYVETLQPELEHRGQWQELQLLFRGKLNFLESTTVLLYQIDMGELTDFPFLHWTTFPRIICTCTIL
jgi:hypothetical protein